jgi:hypothetical protein
LTAALTAEIAAKGVKDTAITAYNLLPRPQQTGVSANVERDILAIAQANRTSGVGYSWGAAAHQSQWSEASSSGNMMAQSFFANSFGGWSQGPGLYFAITDDPVGTVSWAKPDMINPNLMKLTFTDVPTIDITNPVCIAAIAQLAPPGAGSNTVKAQALIYGSILPILMIYGGGKVARLSTSAGVNLNVNMPSFLSTGQLQTMKQSSAMLNVKATLTALLG